MFGEFILNDDLCLKSFKNLERCKFFKVYQNLVIASPFLSFLLGLFLPYKDTFMDDYDGI
jgi:hypothetical protein